MAMGQGASQFGLPAQGGQNGQPARFAQLGNQMQGTDAAGYRYDQSGQPVSPAQKKRMGKTTASPRKVKAGLPPQTAPQPQMQVPMQP